MQMKKMVAVFLALVMALSVASLSVCADTNTEPSITVEGKNVTPGTDTTFDVKLANFSGVKGMDITITGTAGVEFKDIQSGEVTLTKGNNCTVSANKIQVVDINNAPALTLTVTAKVKGDADISVSAKLAADAKELVKSFSIKDGKLTTVTVTEVMGAGVRNRKETDPYALRFGLKASCAGAAYAEKGAYDVNYSSATVTINGTPQKVVRIGAIVAVTDKATGKELVAEDITNETAKYIKNVEAKKAYDITEDTVSYVVAVTGIPTTAVNKSITVRPYILYKDNTGEHYTYGIAQTRSVQDVLSKG